ncbi:MAG: radical SAM protein, partial [Planctomycetaceae bacterium]|nr:radical SAM protein [Planctomycetaceae bacterium]
REFLARDSWNPEPIVFSGVTDCYQPAEREFQLTRECLRVALECRQPVSLITKNALVVRDLDLLQPLAEMNLVHVFVSITTLRADLAREMEPRTSIPTARLRAVRMLAEANVPVGVMTAPVIPGLNDSELPSILKAASESSARTAAYILLRLPLTVEPVFIEWLQRTQPGEAGKVLSRLRETRGGELSSAAWGERMKGKGPIAEQIRSMFQVFRSRYGLNGTLPPHNCQLFHPPASASGQKRLF